MTIDGPAFISSPYSRKRPLSEDSLSEDDEGRLHIADSEETASPTDPVFPLPQWGEGRLSPDIPNSNDSTQAKTPDSVGMAPTAGVSSPEEPATMRMRTHFTPEQVFAMSQLFQTTRYPSRAQYEDLASKIDIEEKAIKLWFQNRRAKLRKLPKAACVLPPPNIQKEASPPGPPSHPVFPNSLTTPKRKRGRRSKRSSGTVNTQYQTMEQVSLPPDHPFCNLAGWTRPSRLPSPPSEDELLSPPANLTLEVFPPHAKRPRPNSSPIMMSPLNQESGYAPQLGPKVPQGLSLVQESKNPVPSIVNNEKLSSRKAEQPLDFSISNLIGTKEEKQSSKADDNKRPSSKSPDNILKTSAGPTMFSPWMAPPMGMPPLPSGAPLIPMMPYMNPGVYPMPYVHPAALSFYGNMGQFWPYGMQATGFMM